MGYQAGNLELSILGFSKEAVASVDLTAKALRRLASAVDTINNTQFVFAGQKLEVLFTKIANATNSINTTNIVNLASAAKSLSSISRISNLEKMDFNKVGKGFETLAIAIQPFLNKVKEAEASLASLDSILRRVSGKKIQGLLGGNDDSSPNKNGLFGLAKVGMILHTARKIGRVMADLVQAGSDYYETLNLWQVAMRNNLDVADKFINKMQRAYGISSKTLMNAQAVFKNMVGSLGQISEATAYALSEALVQMSADYASLYNRTLESAFQNMQSMLAGQVRPIRSAGLDMTETTLYQFYQELGGTKTMRQLNRTEKQLLSILAVYQQMGSAGALGDMTKTLNQFANQSRMMTEYWAELKTWSGLLLKDLIDQSGLLIYINASLITVTEVIKAIAKARGLGEENFIDGMFESAEAANDEVDKLQGKLLDFDKFRSLEGATTSPISVDEKVIEAITGYSSKIDDAKNKAQELAEEWLSILGINKEANGVFGISEDNLSNLINSFNALAITIVILTGKKLIPWLLTVGRKVDLLRIGFSLLNVAILGGAVYAILQAIDAFNRSDVAAGILASTIAIGLVGAFVLLHKKAVVAAIQGIGKFISKCLIANTVNYGFAGGIAATVGGLLAFAAAVGLAFYVFQNWDTMNGIQKVISVIGVLTVALLGAAIAFGAFHSAWSLGLAIVGIAAGIAAVVASVQSAQKDIENISPSTNSNIDQSIIDQAYSISGKGNTYKPSNSTYTSGNAQQMSQAELKALNEWWAKAKYDIPAFQGVSDSGLYTIVNNEANRRGKKFAKA